MPDVRRTIKLVTEQHVLSEKQSGVEGFPLRAWTISIFLLNEKGEEVPANIFERAIYKLHPTFPNPRQEFTKPPFKIEEEGWGEFDMEIALTAIDKGGEFLIAHDLNFQSPHYEAKHTLTFRNPRPTFLNALRESGSVPDEIPRPVRKSHVMDESLRKKKRVERNVSLLFRFDMLKLADNLQKLGEDDLLQVVQMIHDNKTAETYTKNDVELGEFHVDLYTLPEHLIKMLWDFTAERTTI